MRTVFVLVLMIAQCIALAGGRGDVFIDGFVGSWTWVPEDSTGWQLDNDTLRIRSDPGALAMDNENANMPLWIAPNTPFAVEVTVEFLPTSLYEQAGLVLYFNDANYAKLQMEMVDEGRALTFTREVSGEFMELGHMAFKGRKVRLRMEYHIATVTALAKADDEISWRQLGKSRLSHQRLRIGLATGAGSSNNPRWANYSGFVVTSFTP